MTADIRTAAQREAERENTFHPESPYQDLENAAFAAGAVWGAARVTPTREQIGAIVQREMGCNRRAHYGNVEQPYCGEHGGYGIWPCRESASVIDAVLKLMQELAEGNDDPTE